MKLTINPAFTIQAQNEDPHVEAVLTGESGEYIVEKHTLASKPFEFRLAIKRADRGPIRSWRLLQDIKNAAVGEDRMAIEVYPRESDVTDTANMYHLWVCRVGYEPPVGLTKLQPDMAAFARDAEAYKRMMDGD